MQFIDTHCHIQSIGQKDGERHTRELWEKSGSASVDEVIERAHQAGVTDMILVGCDVRDSILAVDVTKSRENLFASIGIHPHEAQQYVADTAILDVFSALATEKKVVAVGECGLDYFYTHSPKADQIKILEFQLDLAQKHDLPVIFHVREAFDDFWPVLANFKGLRGVLHSFTDTVANMNKAVQEGFYIGVNGIATFAKDQNQLNIYKSVPIERLLLETDAPYLTPVPLRGKICEPMNIIHTAEFLARLREDSLENLSTKTSKNARSLFGF